MYSQLFNPDIYNGLRAWLLRDNLWSLWRPVKKQRREAGAFPAGWGRYRNGGALLYSRGSCQLQRRVTSGGFWKRHRSLADRARREWFIFEPEIRAVLRQWSEQLAGRHTNPRHRQPVIFNGKVPFLMSYGRVAQIYQKQLSKNVKCIKPGFPK